MALADGSLETGGMGHAALALRFDQQDSLLSCLSSLGRLPTTAPTLEHEETQLRLV